MNEAEIGAKVRDIVQKFAKEDRKPGPDESLFNSGLLDSFSLPDMVSALEEAFNFRIPDSDLNPRQFETLSRIETYVKSHA
jgi:acyl carrier protein